MKVRVRHGHFAFYPQSRVEVLKFQRLFKKTLVSEDDYFTFENLKGLPRWSQLVRPFGNLPALVTYEGRHAWEVMRENGFVYSLALDLLVPFATVFEIVNLQQTLDCAVAPKPLVQPGSVLSSGNVLLGYEGELDLTYQKLFIYSQETLV